MTLIKRILMISVSFTILNVWLLRFNKSTIFRGGNASDMLSEFHAYGLSEGMLYTVGTIKVLLAILLLLGIVYSKLVKPSILAISILMISAIYFHISISDEIIKSVPALIILIFSLTIYFMDVREKVEG
ncbi:MAG: DoxX family protein [Flavobacteriaceae bacterium]